MSLTSELAIGASLKKSMSYFRVGMIQHYHGGSALTVINPRNSQRRSFKGSRDIQ